MAGRAKKSARFGADARSGRGGDARRRAAGSRRGPGTERTQPRGAEQERIAEWLRQVRFRPVLFGGVEESDVWKKISELNAMYETALVAERARYDALLSERGFSPGTSAPDAWGHGGDDSDADAGFDGRMEYTEPQDTDGYWDEYDDGEEDGE